MRDTRHTGGSSPWENLKHTTAREARRLFAQGKKTLLRLRLGQRWQPSDECFARRVYPSYDAYLAHQRTKFDAFRASSIERHDRKFYAALRERLGAPLSVRGRSVLCLAARQGTEVRAFIDEGAFAVGIDLNPGPRNPHVLVGDFHALQFGDGTVDMVYTNSLDHAFDLNRLLGEVRRVLAPGGTLVAEIGMGSEAGGDAGFYEALSWRSVDDMRERIEGTGFRTEHARRFDVPWQGEQLLMRRTD